MDRKISIILPEELWRQLDPNNKSGEARQLLREGMEYRKIKNQLVRQALLLKEGLDSPVFEPLRFYDHKEVALV